MNNNEQLELEVLKGLITSKKSALEFTSEVDITKHNIFSPDLWHFAITVVNYIKTYKEVPTIKILCEKISKTLNNDAIENFKNVWDKVNSSNFEEKEFKFNLEKLKQKFSERQILLIKDKMSKIDSSSLDVNKTVNDLQKSLQNINALGKNQAYINVDVKDYLQTFSDSFNAKKNNPDLDKGIISGYSYFDYATNGIKPADMVLIAGETGFGKSLFLKNIAVQVWLQGNNPFEEPKVKGKNVIYFSLEMPYEDCFNRFIARLSSVPSRDIENASLVNDDFQKIKKCLQFIKKYDSKFTIVDITDANANDIEAILINSEDKYDAVFIDYIGIMKTNMHSEDQDWLKQGIIAYETRAIARKHSIPIFSAVQLNRKSNSKESSDNIGLSRLARSSTIATHATHIIQIESRQNEEAYPDFIYHLIKNRKGPKGKGVLIKNLACSTLLDHKEEHDNYDSFFTDQYDISKEMEDLQI